MIGKNNFLFVNCHTMMSAATVHMDDGCLDYIVNHMGGQAPHVLPVTYAGSELAPPNLCPYIKHRSRGRSMTFRQWFECMEKEPCCSMSDLHTPRSWVLRTLTHTYCQDPHTRHIQKWGRITRVMLSGGMVNTPALHWLPQFGQVCRHAGGKTLVICESAALSLLWRDQCGAHPFAAVSRGSRRAGDGLVGVMPCPDMPDLVVVTQATAVQQLLAENKSAMRVCHFDRVVMHLAQPDMLDPDVVTALHAQWPHSRRWLLCMATLQPQHLPGVFTFLRLRHNPGSAPELAVVLDQSSPACVEQLFKMSCWNLCPNGELLRAPRISLRMATIVPSDTERMLLTHNRQCEAKAAFYATPHKLMRDNLSRFQVTHHLDRHVLCNYYGPGNFEGPLQQLQALAASTHACCVCMDVIPACATPVLPCCHTLCIACHDRILTTQGVMTCPQCRQALPEDIEPLLWVRVDERYKPSSKMCWVRDFYVHHGLDGEQNTEIGGPHTTIMSCAARPHAPQQVGRAANHDIIAWDARPGTLHQLALAIMARVDAGMPHTVRVLLWDGFDAPDTVTHSLRGLLPDGWLPDPILDQ